ncbi:MAG TPA: hypothetical protein VER75_00690 [Thermoleophilaceae bacterium]|nr:hypothetical protein [Thermoleophilaceae bacterium]
MKPAKKSATRTAARGGRKAATKPAPAARPRAPKARAAAAKPQKLDVAALPAARGAGTPAAPTEAVSAPRLLKMVEMRLEERSREFSTTKSRFEQVAKALQGLSAPSTTAEAKDGPRRFRPSATEARKYQQQLGELGTELRLLTARRAELAWVRLMLGGPGPATRPAR